jgi:hypothetical protein
MVKYLRPSSYMTLHPIPSEFPYTVYEENLVFFFISACDVKRVERIDMHIGC